MADHLLTLTDVAAILRISKRKASRLARTAGMPHVVLPDGEVRVDAADLNTWVDQRKLATVEPPGDKEGDHGAP